MFYEFKKKVLRHHRKFTAALQEHNAHLSSIKLEAITDILSTETTELSIKPEMATSDDECTDTQATEIHETEDECTDEHYLDDPDLASVLNKSGSIVDADVDTDTILSFELLEEGPDNDEEVDRISTKFDIVDDDPDIEDEVTDNRRLTSSRDDKKFVYDGDDDDQLEMLVEYIDDDIDDAADSDDNGAGAELPTNLASLVEGLPDIVPDVVRVTRNGKVVEALECPECDEIVLGSFEQHVM